jgi:signal transduction histidine kinase
MFKTINSKFIIFTIIFIILSVGIPTVFLITQFRENFKQRSIIMLESTMDVVNSCVRNTMYIGRHKDVQKIIENISINVAVDHIRIFNSEGFITHSSDSTDIAQNINILSPGHVNLNNIDRKNIRLLRAQRIYSVTQPIYNESFCQDCHGSEPVIAYLDVDTDLTRAELNFYTGSTHMIFLGIAVILVLFFGFYFLFNHFINRPLARFRMALDEVEKGNLDIELPAQKADEIGILEGHFNRMTENLKSSKEKIEELHFDQLQRADKLVTLGELAAEMAHEINNPTAIIMTRADYMQLKVMEDKNLNKYEEDLDVIINQVQKVSRITGSILKYSKKRSTEFSSINLQHIVEESLHILEPRLYKRKVTVTKNFNVENPLILGDSQQIDQVIPNLVNNAIDAMDEKGSLNLEISKNEQNQIQLSITDDGHGMDDQTLEQIFSPFFTTKQAGKGTGLGLYIVKNIIHNHNAQISCTSEPGRGTTFILTFNWHKDKK